MRTDRIFVQFVFFRNHRRFEGEERCRAGGDCLQVAPISGGAGVVVALRELREEEKEEEEAGEEKEMMGGEVEEVEGKGKERWE